MGKATKLAHKSGHAVLLDVRICISIREAQSVKLYLATGGRCGIEECKTDLHISGLTA